MITERRQIIFSNEALKDAVRVFRTAYPGRVPYGQIVRAWAVGEPEVSVQVEIEPPGARRFQTIRLAKPEIAAAIILYCRRNRIPLPRTSDKFLDMEAGCLTLVMTKQFHPAAIQE